MSEEPTIGDDNESLIESASSTAGLDAAIESAQAHLRGVLEAATSTAREEVAKAANALAVRQADLDTREAAVSAEKETLELGREEVAKRLAAAGARQRLADSKLEEANHLNDRASKALAEAVERASVIVEEAEKKVHEDEARAKALIQIELDEARAEAATIHKQAASRLEAVSAESEAVLRRAVDRAGEIVAIAQQDAERSKADLRQIVSHIQEFLKTVPEATRFDLQSELDIDLRPQAATPNIPEVETDAPVPNAVAGETASDVEPDVVADVQPGVAAESPRIDEWASLMPERETASDTVADDSAMEAYFDDAEVKEDPDEGSQQRIVADAVRRAVQEWSTSRQKAQ